MLFRAIDRYFSETGAVYGLASVITPLLAYSARCLYDHRHGIATLFWEVLSCVARH